MTELTQRWTSLIKKKYRNIIYKGAITAVLQKGLFMLKILQLQHCLILNSAHWCCDFCCGLLMKYLTSSVNTLKADFSVRLGSGFAPIYYLNGPLRHTWKSHPNQPEQGLICNTDRPVFLAGLNQLFYQCCGSGCLQDPDQLVRYPDPSIIKQNGKKTLNPTVRVTSL